MSNIGGGAGRHRQLRKSHAQKHITQRVNIFFHLSFDRLFYTGWTSGAQNCINHNPTFITGFYNLYIKGYLSFMCCSFVGLLTLTI